MELIVQLEQEIGCKLPRIEDEGWDPLPKPKQAYQINTENYVIGIYLSEIALPHYPQTLLQFPHLKYLLLWDNKLTTLPQEIGRLTAITHLSVSNDIAELPQEIWQLTTLHYLRVNGYLTELPREIKQLKNLTHLIISHNRLTILPAEIGQLTNLQNLFVDYNDLTMLPSEIGQLTKLFYLNVSHNHLTALPPEIGQLHLSYLDVRNNRLTKLPYEICHIEHLHCLNLLGNPLPHPLSEISESKVQAIFEYVKRSHGSHFTQGLKYLNSTFRQLLNMSNKSPMSRKYGLKEFEKIQMIDTLLTKNTVDMDIIQKYQIRDLVVLEEELLTTQNKNKRQQFLNSIDDISGNTIGEPELIVVLRYYFRQTHKQLKCHCCGRILPFISESPALNENYIVGVSISGHTSIIKVLDNSTEGTCARCCKVTNGDIQSCCKIAPTCALRSGMGAYSNSHERIDALINGVLPGMQIKY